MEAGPGAGVGMKAANHGAGQRSGESSKLAVPATWGSCPEGPQDEASALHLWSPWHFDTAISPARKGRWLRAHEA
jgi:hypothetical protein